VIFRQKEAETMTTATQEDLRIESKSKDIVIEQSALFGWVRITLTDIGGTPGEVERVDIHDARDAIKLYNLLGKLINSPEFWRPSPGTPRG